jgi:hypothetical protein
MKKIGNIPNLILLIIAAISVLAFALLMANMSPDVKNAAMGNWININLRWMYVLLFLAILLLVFFAVFQLVSEFQSAKGSLLGIGVMALIFLIGFLFASKEYPKFFGVEKFIADGTITPAILKIIDTGLISTYIMFGLAILALIYTSLSRYFK